MSERLQIRTKGVKVTKGVVCTIHAYVEELADMLPAGGGYKVGLTKDSTGMYICKIGVQNGREYISRSGEATRLEFAIRGAVRGLQGECYAIKGEKQRKKRKRILQYQDIQREQSVYAGMTEAEMLAYEDELAEAYYMSSDQRIQER